METETVTQDQIQDLAVCNSHNANISIITSIMWNISVVIILENIIGQTGLLSLSIRTGLGEGKSKLLNST